MGPMVERAQITVKGVVQGVGFRPYVYSLARKLGLHGSVANTAEGVLIDVEGARVSEFIQRLPREAPLLSRIIDVAVIELPSAGHRDFAIHPSTDTGSDRPFTLVSPDVSICDDCLQELLDPSDRRYLYPFINCTQCGPRYSITRAIPYDRPNTTMADFILCPECSREYHDPTNRRFHAQPNACGRCGPSIQFRVRSFMEQADRVGVENTATRLPRSNYTGDEAFQRCIETLQSGGIVAIKGLGGFHLACDAANDEAVKQLRVRKRKSNKPFAVMAPHVEAARRFCRVSDSEKALLESGRRPIVLLAKQRTADRLSEAIAPGNGFIGCMLPYTPLHYLLFYQPAGEQQDEAVMKEPHFRALVMTSGNLSEEPIVRDNDEAMQKLSGLVDAFLLHDRDIFMRVDDSVVRVLSSEFGVRNEQEGKNSFHTERRTPDAELLFIRRSRGYAPEPITLHEDGPEVLGCGADLKNTFTLTKGSFAVPSQHIGDMENYETLRFFEETLENLKQVYRVNPVAIAHDLHPGYMTTKWAIECGMQNAECGMKVLNSEPRTPNSALERYAIQHHYAHVGSVMAENGITEKVIGVALDGTGYGTDGRLWGGEFLIADIHGFRRAAHFHYIPLPGGESAIREPWRTAVSYIADAAGPAARDHLDRIGFVKQYGQDILEQVLRIRDVPDVSPLSSGAGRLFDAVSAILGICNVNTFEGEAAMALEAAAAEEEQGEYEAGIRSEDDRLVVDWAPVIDRILAGRAGGVSTGVIAARFHNTVASVIRKIVIDLNDRFGLNEVVLSGGTFQNLYLLRKCRALLAAEGMTVLTNRMVPANDAGISLGQAYIVRERIKKA